MLRVSVSVYEHGEEWMPLHTEPSVLPWEVEYGRDISRTAHNDKCVRAALRSKKTVRAELFGYSDLFVPIVMKGQVVALLVAGPLLGTPPSGASVLERWHALTGRRGHASEPGFQAYLSAALSVLVLNGSRLRAFERLLECLARLMAGEGRADELMNRVEALRAELEPARLAERSWELVRDIIDDRTHRSPHSGPRRNDLRDAGLTRTTDHVLVCLGKIVSGGEGVEEIVARHSFQRAAAELAYSFGDAIAGKVGDHGVVFLSGGTGNQDRRRRRAFDLAERARALGRKFGLSVYSGVSPASPLWPLATSYQTALGAAESALIQERRVVVLASKTGSRDSLRKLRRDLARSVVERPDLFDARFERYLETVGVESGYRLDATRFRLETGFEQMTEKLRESGVLDERTAATLVEALDRAASTARTTSDLIAAYRAAAREISAAVKKPGPAQRERSLKRALEYIHQHYAEPLRRNRVARVSGFAPGYFSELFKRRERMSFEQYVLRLRIEHAKQLLEGTDLDAARVGQLSGFKSAPHFSRAFKLVTKTTPLDHRRAQLRRGGKDIARRKRLGDARPPD
jgi:AraC-like DNA-binding protein